nr:hypothetical protein [Chromobacterium amazonense]
MTRWTVAAGKIAIAPVALTLVNGDSNKRLGSITLFSVSSRTISWMNSIWLAVAVEEDALRNQSTA